MNPISRRGVGPLLVLHGAGRHCHLHAQKLGVREIARRLGRSPSTISRELPSNASCPLGRGGSSIERPWRSGTPSAGLDDRRSRTWSPTHVFADTCRTAWPRASEAATGAPWWAPMPLGGSQQARANSGAGRRRGVRSTPPTACRSTSPKMGRRSSRCRHGFGEAAGKGRPRRRLRPGL